MSDDGYKRTWQRLVARDEIRGIAARLDDRMVGIAHYLFQLASGGPADATWADLFVARKPRREGIATAMLTWVARDAEEHDAPRFYWNTELDNVDARALCDKVAKYKGFTVTATNATRPSVTSNSGRPRGRSQSDTPPQARKRGRRSVKGQDEGRSGDGWSASANTPGRD